jgi:hypothetical protein
MIDYKIKQDPNIPHLMLEVWESRIPTDSPLSLNPKRRATLKLLFTHVFGSRLSRWDAFVDLIVSSDVLMDKASKAKKSGKSAAFLDWVIKPETCLTILGGVYTDVELDELGKEVGDELEDLADKEETLIGKSHG